METHTPPGHSSPGRGCSLFPEQQQDKMDQTGPMQTCQSSPMPKAWALLVLSVPSSQSQTLTLSPQQTRALPDTRCPMPALCISVPLPIPGSSLGWTSANSRSQPRGCPWVQNPTRAAAQQAAQGTGKRPGGVSAGMRLEERSFLLKTAASASLSLE